MHIAHAHQCGRIGHNNTGAFERNQRQKQADTGGNRHFQRHGQSIHQSFAHFKQAENNKNNARHKHRAQRHLPGHAHAFDHRISKISIQAHARRQGNRIIGQHAHHKAADGRSDASGHKHRPDIHAGFRQNQWVDNDDVAHGQKSGQAGEQFRADIAAVFFQLE